MLLARIDFCLFSIKEGKTGDFKERHYFTGTKWFDIHDPLFLIGIESAYKLIGDNGFVEIKFKKGDEIDGKEEEND